MVGRPGSRRGSAASVVVVLLAVALLGIGIWHFLLRSTPEKTLSQMLEAVRTGDEDTIRSHLTARSDAEGNLVMGLVRGLSGDPTGEPPYTIGESVVTDMRASVPVEFPLGDTFRRLTGKGSITIPFVLHRDGLTWLVDVPDTQDEVMQKVSDTMMDLIWRFVAPHAPPLNRGERHI